jgi:Zn-dependent protease with chaperone function
MIAAFLPLVFLSFGTIQFEGTLLLFPGAALVAWLFLSFGCGFFFLPRVIWRLPLETALEELPRLQMAAQWGTVLWICLFHAVSAPAYWLYPAIHRLLPQAWPLLTSIVLYFTLLHVVSRTFHASFLEVFQTGQSQAEFFRARLTLPILFFPPILLWMTLEDLLTGSIAYSPLAEIWLLALAPLFFVGLYLLSPHLFNLAWKAEPLVDERIQQEIVHLSEKCRTPIAGVKIWDTFKEPLPNAAVAGLASRYRFVYITRFLLEILPGREVAAVVAHELGHFRLGHVWTYLFFTLNLVFGSVLVKLTIFFQFPHASKIYADYSAFIDPVFFLGGFLLVFTALTRHSERQADRFATSLVGAECFSRAMVTLQDFLGKPVRKIPWWIETHPDFSERLEVIRDWKGTPETLIRQARFLRIGLILLALCTMLLIKPNAQTAWEFSSAAQATIEGRFQDSQTILDQLSLKLGRHPQIVEMNAALCWKAGKWHQAMLLAMEGAWQIPLMPLTPVGSEILHHAVSPEVAFELQIMQFLLQSLDLGGVHGIPLFNQCFNLIQTIFGHL